MKQMHFEIDSLEFNGLFEILDTVPRPLLKFNTL